MKNIFIFFLTFCLQISAFSQNRRMIDEIRDHKTGTAVWWIGQDSWIIKSGDLVIGNDIYLDNSERISAAPVTAEELAEVIDIAFVTHGHGDHFGRYASRIISEQSSALFILPENCIEEAHKLNIPDDRIVVAKPREPFEIMGIKVTPLRALHGNANFAIYYDANLQDVGYMLTIAGKTYLQPGDTYLLEDHLFLKHVDVLFFSPTEHNMYIDRSVILINALDPDYIFPQHFGTMVINEGNRFWTKGYPDEVKILLSQPLKDKYHKLKPGDKVEIK